MITTLKKERRSYSPEEDKLILEMVDGAKAQGMSLSAVYKMLSEDLNRTEGALAKRYGDLKKKEKEELSAEKQEVTPEPPFSHWQSTVNWETDGQKLDQQTISYAKADTEATMRMYESLKEAEQKTPDVSLEALVNKLEQVITEKIELRIERDYYKKKYEELKERYDNVRRLLED